MKAPKTFPVVIRESGCTARIYRQDRTGDGRGVSYILAEHSTGKRRLRAFADFEEAKAEALRIVRLVSRGESEAAALGSPERAAYGRAVALLAPSKVPLELAASIIAAAVELVPVGEILAACRSHATARRSVTAKRVSDAVADFLSVKEARQKSHRHLTDLKSRLERFGTAFQCNLGDVTTAGIQAWLDGLKLAPQSLKNYRTVIGSLFVFGLQRGWCASNPVAGVEKFEVQTGEPEIYSPGELRRLLEVATPDFLPALAVGAFAGLRSAEIQRLDWQNVDLKRRHIIVSAGTAKTRSRRVVPICEALAAWLSPFARESGLLFAGPVDLYFNRQKEIAAAAGIGWKANGLRHSFATYRFALTNDETRTAAELGNSAAVVHRHYRALAHAETATEWFSVIPVTPSNIIALPAKGAAA